MPRLTNLFGLEKQLIRKQIEVIYRHNPRLFFPRCFVNISLAFLGLKKQYFENFNIELGSSRINRFIFSLSKVTFLICLNKVYNALHDALMFFANKFVNMFCAKA